MPRTQLIGGNWKMNGDRNLVDVISATLNGASLASGVEVVVAPPAPYLALARSKFAGHIGVAAQNASSEKSGAFTGEISVDMLKDLSINWVILGHSERRELFGESDDTIGRKVVFAVKNGIKVIACVGEKLEHREAGKTTEVVFRQLEGIRAHLTPEDWAHIVVAYEPVWAIGTGKVATPQQAQEVHEQIRSWLASHVSPAVAEATRIIYGGSVNAKNSSTLQSEKDIDGFLVGGASLKADDFLTICHSKI
ncbi:triosephosphate isomerase [Polyrhizophydium stewartii]|uniref:Triosephosphate isomerase n=1 Tax=Polyrhizophydium stewartii TaxID=2732419 RepID=A0ABR4NCQ8_9FUNG|nr:triosephosphate isomerase [Polyrhizophydium stewartii]